MTLKVEFVLWNELFNFTRDQQLQKLFKHFQFQCTLVLGPELKWTQVDNQLIKFKSLTCFKIGFSIVSGGLVVPTFTLYMYTKSVEVLCKRWNFVSNYVISSHTHSVSVLYNFSSATHTYFHWC